MTTPIHLQHTIDATPDAVYHALTDNDALKTWFAEHADVGLEAGHYNFWGCFTPETPSRQLGVHQIEVAEPNRRLRYVWHLRAADTRVEFRLTARAGKCVIGVWHQDVPHVPQGEPGCYSMGDIWWLWLENLRRYCEGKSVSRCDFSANMTGNVVQSIDINGSAESVWNALTDPDARNRWISANATNDIAVGDNWTEWGEHGSLKILDIQPGTSFSMAWEIDDTPTVVTWTVEGAGNKTRLTLAHSGFAPDRRGDAEWGGWISYLSLVQSMVEYGVQWLPPIQEIVNGAAMYYAISVWQRQEELMENEDAEWEVKEV